MEERPILLFEWRFVLMHPEDRDKGVPLVPRPGIHHLLSLLPYFRLGIVNGQKKMESAVEATDKKFRTERLPVIINTCHKTNKCTKVMLRSSFFIRSC